MAKTATKLPIKTERKAAATPHAKGEIWSPFESLRQEIDRLFEDFAPSRWRLPRAADIDWPPAWQVAPAMDIVEKDGAFEITAELPGIDEKNVEIKLANGTLTIKGEKSEEKEEKGKEYYLSERRYGAFQRSFRLPDGVDADRIAATFAKGVLTVTLPKTAEAKKSARKIDVKSA
ncbi:MAG: molecular chaperone Hsp20 [Alphaproteobacteria bacterium]|nr:MAG: molecular chaperone Hsp20 [Alphaproteobacteria bacterium]